MKCSRCGADIKEGSLHCDLCGEEVRIVPDYSSLDEVLAENVREEIQSEKRKPHKKKRNQKKIMLILLSTLLAAILIGFIVYQGSYAGQIQKGYHAFEKENYNKAIKYFRSASEKEPERAEAYIGLSEVYLKMKDVESAEKIFLKQIEEQKSNADIYRALAEFYEKTGQTEKIPLLLNACSVESVQKAMADYMVEIPEFSLTEGTYDEAKQLKLSSDGNTVYYTLDETVPTIKDGTKYGTAIQLDEGKWIVKAIAVNKKGIPSLMTEKKYAVELPIADPPIIYPSTGLYETEMEITIRVEEGFTAYYLFDETEVTPENGKKYLGPMKMPEGNHIFSAILVDNRTGKSSEAAVRNYDLQLNSVETTEE